MKSPLASLLLLSMLLWLPLPTRGQEQPTTVSDGASDTPAAMSTGTAAVDVTSLDGGSGGEGAGSGRGIQLGALVGYGLSFDDNVGSVNPLGLGLGALGGVELGSLYLGGRVQFYLGSGSDLPTGRLSMSEWLLAAEVGYALDLGSVLVLRPGLALGAAFFSQDGPTRTTAGPSIGGTLDDTRTRIYLGPGASLLLPFGRLSRDLALLYAGLDLRVGLYVGDPTSGSFESSLLLGVEI